MLAGPKAGFGQPHPATGMHPGGIVNGPFDRHHGICPGGHRGAGHDPGTAAGADRKAGGVTGRQLCHDIELDNLGGRIGGGKVGPANGEAVHHRPVPRGRIDVGQHRVGQFPTDRRLQPHPPRRQGNRRLFDQPNRLRHVDHAVTTPPGRPRNARTRS